MIVELNAFDLQWCAMYTERFYVVKAVTNAKSMKRDTNKSEWEIQYLGSLGERAVQKITKCKLSTKVFAGGDREPDTIICGMPAQIKAFSFTGQRWDVFVDNEEALKRVEIIVAVQVLSPVRMNVAGWIDKYEFLTKAKPKNYGHGLRPSVSATLLVDILDLPGLRDIDA